MDKYEARAWLADRAEQHAASEATPDLGADTPENRARLERLLQDILAAGERIGTEPDEQAAQRAAAQEEVQ